MCAFSLEQAGLCFLELSIRRGRSLAGWTCDRMGRRLRRFGRRSRRRRMRRVLRRIHRLRIVRNTF